MKKETKQCPYCGEEILFAAKKCKHCGEWLEEASASAPTPQVKQAAPTSEAGIIEQTTDVTVGEPKKTKIESEPESSDKSFIGAFFIDVLRHHYADFSGTMSRKQYWIFGLLCCIFIVLPSMIATLLDGVSGMCMYTVLCLFALVPSLSAAVRRMHDIGKSGWMILVCFIPVAGPIWLLVLLCKAGKTKSPKTKWNLDSINGLMQFLLILAIVGFSIAKIGRIVWGDAAPVFDTEEPEQATSVPVDERKGKFIVHNNMQSITELEHSGIVNTDCLEVVYTEENYCIVREDVDEEYIDDDNFYIGIEDGNSIKLVVYVGGLYDVDCANYALTLLGVVEGEAAIGKIEVNPDGPSTVSEVYVYNPDSNSLTIMQE